MLHIRTMTLDDLELAMLLKDQAGWNQTVADWRRFLEMEPTGCFVADWDGRLVGTTVNCIFGQVAWVAMVLVDPEFRGRGIGRALMSHALGFLDDSGVSTVRLDATPLGEPLYKKLGFTVEYGLARFEGTPQPATPVHGKVDHVLSSDYPLLFQMDQLITGADRSKFLSRLFAEQSEQIRVVRSAETIAGFLACRHGTRAWQIGPCLAGRGIGSVLLADALCRFVGTLIYVDIPGQNDAAGNLAERSGLAVQRRLVRMRRGPPVAERTDHIWASSGPELG
ncbi:MAG TPA: GNAT family N-acetyltransferase [Gemmataceae bacterium]|nr:GNAT family N-acetyltransferase [Gemmataceae bacterium]